MGSQFIFAVLFLVDGLLLLVVNCLLLLLVVPRTGEGEGGDAPALGRGQHVFPRTSRAGEDTQAPAPYSAGLPTLPIHRTNLRFPDLEIVFFDLILGFVSYKKIIS